MEPAGREGPHVDARARVDATVESAITSMPAARLSDLVRTGELSAQDVVAAHLRRIAEVDRTVRAFVSLDADGALEQARLIDQQRRRGRRIGSLAGVPVVVKDNIDVRRQTTSSGSRAHAGVLALRDAPAVARLRAAGAIVLGRANMDELAMGASTQTSAFGATRNPWDVRRSPGGSSGGSAAAVAAGLAALSVGSDTGGSIREPAAQCGVVGMAPTPGLVPVAGVVPFAPGLDRVGPLARTVGDAARLLAVLSGRRTAAGPARVDPACLRVGVVVELAGAANQPAVLARLAATQAVLADLGIDLVRVSMPGCAAGLGAYTRITSAACVAPLTPWVRSGQAGDEVIRRWELGRRLLRDGAAELAGARRVRRRLIAESREALRHCDVLLSPAMPTTAPLLTDPTADRNGTSAADLADPMAAPYTDCWSVVANLAGLPALSIPAGHSAVDGMPVGVMLAGRPGADGALLALAAAMESRRLAGR